MTNKLQPLSDRVLIQPVKVEAKSAGGLWLPEGAKETPQEGTVIAVGPGRMSEPVPKNLNDPIWPLCPMNVKVGDRVIFQKYGGCDLKIDGEDYKLLGQDDVLAIVNK